MNYKLQLFKNIEFSPDDNMAVGTTAELEKYLSSRLVFSTTTQNLIRFRPTISVVVNTGAYSLTYLAIDYCEITAPGTAGRTKWFYFVDSVEFVSRNAIRVNRTIDYLNTFYNSVTFYNDCHIVRRFKDRWHNTDNGYFPYYDRTSEGFNITQILDNSKTKIVRDFPNEQVAPPEWLLVTGTQTSNNKQSLAVRYYPVPSGYNTIKATYTDIANSSQHVSNRNLPVTYQPFEHDLTGELISVTTTDQQPNFDITFKADKTFYLPYYPPVLTFTGTASGLIDAGHTKTGTYYFRGDWDDPSVDKDNYVTWFGDKAYSVLETYSRDYNTQYVSRKLYAGSRNDFGLNLEFRFITPTGSTKAERQEARRTREFSPDDHDPKLGTSEFTTCKTEYLGSSFTIAPERVTGQLFGGLDIIYYVSPTSTNPVRFKINPLNWNGLNKYEYQEDDRGYLIPTADLSFPRWTSEYNQYRNFSNRYDKLSCAIAYANAHSSLASSVTDAVSGGAVGGPVGMGLGIAKAGFSALSSVISTWNSQQAKEASRKQQSRNVSQSSIDFATIQTKNKIRLLRYDIPEYLKKSLTRYFHLFGYAEDRYADPHGYDHKRYAFDFLKMDFVDYNKSEVEPAFRDGFEEKRKDGFYVRHVLQDMTPTSFDFRKANANREISLIEGRD